MRAQCREQGSTPEPLGSGKYVACNYFGAVLPDFADVACLATIMFLIFS